MAASVMLGSTLLAAAQADSNIERTPASTGCSSIDTALGGGFPYGRITSIAGAGGMGKSHV